MSRRDPDAVATVAATLAARRRRRDPLGAEHARAMAEARAALDAYEALMAAPGRRRAARAAAKRRAADTTTTGEG